MNKTSANFWSKVDKSTANGCWLWVGCVRPNGYGWFNFHRTPMNAHRVAYMLANGVEIPKGMDVCHSCDVRNCVNPAHLWLGTRKDNVDDMHAKNRALKARGEGASNVKLTAPMVAEIRTRKSAGETLVALAEAFNVSMGCISHITTWRNWKHVK